MKTRFAVLAAILLCSAILTSAEWPSQYPRPRRPERFDTAEQINNYLKELQEYYSVHGRGRVYAREELAKYINELRGHYSIYGRGRYGKRQMHIADSSVTYKETPFFDHNTNENNLFKYLGFN